MNIEQTEFPFVKKMVPAPLPFKVNDILFQAEQSYRQAVQIVQRVRKSSNLRGRNWDRGQDFGASPSRKAMRTTGWDYLASGCDTDVYVHAKMGVVAKILRSEPKESEIEKLIPAVVLAKHIPRVFPAARLSIVPDPRGRSKTKPCLFQKFVEGVEEKYPLMEHESRISPKLRQKAKRIEKQVAALGFDYHDVHGGNYRLVGEQDRVKIIDTSRFTYGREVPLAAKQEVAATLTPRMIQTFNRLTKQPMFQKAWQKGKRGGMYYLTEGGKKRYKGD